MYLPFVCFSPAEPAASTSMRQRTVCAGKKVDFENTGGPALRGEAPARVCGAGTSEHGNFCTYGAADSEEEPGSRRGGLYPCRCEIWPAHHEQSFRRRAIERLNHIRPSLHRVALPCPTALGL